MYFQSTRNSNINIAYSTNTLEKHLGSKRPKKEPFDKSGVYNMNCQSCPGNYVDQTGWSFKVRYSKHVQAIRTNNEKTGYFHYILNMGHSYGSLDDSLEILSVQKVLYLNTLEKFHIYRTKQTGYLLNDIHADTYNAIFELLIDHCSLDPDLRTTKLLSLSLSFMASISNQPSSSAGWYNTYFGHIGSITKVSVCPTCPVYCRPPAYYKNKLYLHFVCIYHIYISDSYECWPGS
jgi:hypothetical protein